MSIALRHKRKTLQKQEQNKLLAEAGQAVEEHKLQDQLNAPALAEMFNKLEADLDALRAIPDHSQKDALKVELVEKYRPAAQEIMNKFQSWKGQMIIFWWLMWRLDLEGFEGVKVEMLEGVSKDLTTASNFERDWQTIYLDSLQNYLTDKIAKEQAFEQTWLDEAISKLEAKEITTNNALASKLYVHQGKLAHEQGNLEKAIPALEKALELNDRAGVKTLLKEALKEAEATDNQKMTVQKDNQDKEGDEDAG